MFSTDWQHIQMASSVSPDENDWPKESVLLLISLYKELLPLFKVHSPKNPNPWEVIGCAMEDSGHHQSSEACSKMFKVLKDRYLIIIDEDEPSDKRQEEWPFFHLMDEVMAGNPVVRPRCLVSTFPGEKMPLGPTVKRRKTPHMLKTSDLLDTSCEPEPLLAPTYEQTPSVSLPTHHPGLPEPLSTSEHNPSVSPPTHQPDLPEPFSTHEPTLSSTSGCDDNEDIMKCVKHGKSRVEKYNENPVLWFQAFLEKQGERMDEHIELQKKLLEEAREKNRILRRLTESLENVCSRR